MWQRRRGSVSPPPILELPVRESTMQRSLVSMRGQHQTQTYMQQHFHEPFKPFAEKFAERRYGRESLESEELPAPSPTVSSFQKPLPWKNEDVVYDRTFSESPTLRPQGVERRPEYSHEYVCRPRYAPGGSVRSANFPRRKYAEDRCYQDPEFIQTVDDQSVIAAVPFKDEEDEQQEIVAIPFKNEDFKYKQSCSVRFAPGSPIRHTYEYNMAGARNAFPEQTELGKIVGGYSTSRLQACSSFKRSSSADKIEQRTMARQQAKRLQMLDRIKREEELIDQWKLKKEAKTDAQFKRIEEKLEKLRIKETIKFEKKKACISRKAEKKKAAIKAREEPACPTLNSIFHKIVS